MPSAALSPAVGTSVVSMVVGLRNIPRSLYLYENMGVEPQTVPARALYLYENMGVEIVPVADRALYLYENLQIDALVLLARSLYVYENLRDGEVFPWLMKLDPTEQYRGGQVDLYGDGFGELLEAAAGATITTSSVSGGNVGGNTVDRTTSAWVCTDVATDAWIRFTFGAPKTIVGIALEARTTAPAWGAPVFRFSDGGADVVGASLGLLDASLSSTEYPVGGGRVYYALPAPRTTTYVEVRSTANGTTGRGLREVWILEDLDQAAESSASILNDGLVTETALGIAAWSNRSPGLWPANGGVPITKAATVTLPADAESGLVIVEESA